MNAFPSRSDAQAKANAAVSSQRFASGRGALARALDRVSDAIADHFNVYAVSVAAVLVLAWVAHIVASIHALTTGAGSALGYTVVLVFGTLLPPIGIIHGLLLGSGLGAIVLAALLGVLALCIWWDQ